MDVVSMLKLLGWHQCWCFGNGTSADVVDVMTMSIL